MEKLVEKVFVFDFDCKMDELEAKKAAEIGSDRCIDLFDRVGEIVIYEEDYIPYNAALYKKGENGEIFLEGYYNGDCATLSSIEEMRNVIQEYFLETYRTRTSSGHVFVEPLRGSIFA